jgi:ankyrin repeat protein
LLAGANPNARDINLRTPLHRLFDFLDISVLLKKGANPNAKDIYKRTPLFYTFRPDVVTALINAGANPKARDIYGRSSLFYSYNDSIRTLLKTMGAPFEEQGKSSRFIKLIKDWLQDPAAPPSLHRKKY